MVAGAVGIGAPRFLQPRGQDAPSGDDVGQESLQLLGIAVPGDRVGTQHQGRERRHRSHTPANLGQQHTELDEAAT